MTVAAERIAAVGPGFLILVGVAKGDTPFDAAYLARKASQLRLFDDPDGKMNLALSSVGGAVLVVSQFTLYGECEGGNRPSYLRAAPPSEARPLYEEFVSRLKALVAEVQTGAFGENMQVELVNDGPVTLLLESEGRTAL